MKSLYLLTESDFDSLIYEALVTRLTNDGYVPVCRRMRKGSGVGAVRASLAVALKEVSRMAQGSGVCFLVAMDNDRAPIESGDALTSQARNRLSHFDQRKSDRLAMLTEAIKQQLESGASDPLTPIAVAVPVEMIETWLLLIARGGLAEECPRFSRQDSTLAKQFHHPSAPPAQLKDRCETAQVEDGFQYHDEWALHLIFERLSPEDLARRAHSFALLAQSLSSWPKLSEVRSDV